MTEHFLRGGPIGCLKNGIATGSIQQKDSRLVERELLHEQPGGSIQQVAYARSGRDALGYSLDAAPAGMSVGGVNGRVEWTPAPGQEGLTTVTLRVEDAWRTDSDGKIIEEFSIP